MLMLLLALSAHAQDPVSGVTMSDPAMAILSFLGAAPAFADERMAFQFGLAPPNLVSDRTGIFSALPDGPGVIDHSQWIISPYLALNGRFATAQVGVDLALPRKTTLPGGYEFIYSGSAKVMYHSGVNLLFFLPPEKISMALGVGPLLHTSIGPISEVIHPDGESTATFGRIGQVHLAPSVSYAWLANWWSIGLMGGYAPQGIPWSFVDATGGEADGVFAGADPGNPQSVNEAADSLGKIRNRGSLLASGYIGFNLYRASEPFLTIGARAEYRHHDYLVLDGSFGHSSGYVDEEVRISVGIGIGVPPGYDFTQ